MKNTIKLMIGLLAVGFVSCEPEFDTPVAENFYSNGDADFSNYVAVGNSLTSGYGNGALYISGQEDSYPNIMAQQFALAGGGVFTQPLMNDNLGGLLLGGSPLPGFGNRLILSVDANGNPGPAPLEGQGTTEVSNFLSGPFNNMGVPGAKSYDLGFEGYGNVGGIPNANPYFVRMATSPNATVIGDAVAQSPSFFSLWIGNNDVLSYATGGGVGVDQTGNLNPATYGRSDITDPNVFAAVYTGYVEALTANGAGGVLINIPDVTSLPYFTTVPFAPLSPLDPNFGPQIPTLNATYAPLNAAFAFLGLPERSIVFSTTAASAVVVQDESLENIAVNLTQTLIGGGLDVATATVLGLQYGQVRQATAADLLVLPSSGVIGQPNAERFAELVGLGVPEATAGQLSINGVTYGLQDQFVLTPPEQEGVSAAAAAYNTTIQGLAAENGLAYADARSALAQVANGGVGFDGGRLTSVYVSGGTFSLDGVHPSSRGYAFAANVIINEINSVYNATIPTVNLGDYGTVTVHNNL